MAASSSSGSSSTMPSEEGAYLIVWQPVDADGRPTTVPGSLMGGNVGHVALVVNTRDKNGQISTSYLSKWPEGDTKDGISAQPTVFHDYDQDVQAEGKQPHKTIPLPVTPQELENLQREVNAQTQNPSPAKYHGLKANCADAVGDALKSSAGEDTPLKVLSKEGFWDDLGRPDMVAERVENIMSTYLIPKEIAKGEASDVVIDEASRAESKAIVDRIEKSAEQRHQERMQVAETAEKMRAADERNLKQKELDQKMKDEAQKRHELQQLKEAEERKYQEELEAMQKKMKEEEFQQQLKEEEERLEKEIRDLTATAEQLTAEITALGAQVTQKESELKQEQNGEKEEKKGAQQQESLMQKFMEMMQQVMQKIQALSANPLMASLVAALQSALKSLQGQRQGAQQKRDQHNQKANAHNAKANGLSQETKSLRDLIDQKKGQLASVTNQIGIRQSKKNQVATKRANVYV